MVALVSQNRSEGVLVEELQRRGRDVNPWSKQSRAERLRALVLEDPGAVQLSARASTQALAKASVPNELPPESRERGGGHRDPERGKGYAHDRCRVAGRAPQLLPAVGGRPCRGHAPPTPRLD